MGHFSDLAIMEAEQTLNLNHIKGHVVCAACFGDPHIKHAIVERRSADHCDYCRATGDGVVAAELTAVMEFMLPQIELEYASADQSLPRDPETKDRMFPEEEFDSRELLETHIELELPNDDDGTLVADIASALPEQDWCLVNPLGTPDDEAIGNSWEAFKKVVKHRRRFFFLQHTDRDLYHDLTWGEAAYNVPELLERISKFAHDHSLIIRLASGSLWFRVQQLGDGEHDFSPRRMGPPPYELANLPNRMSPAGIPMFYGAIDQETALTEVADHSARFASARFETMKDVFVLDLRLAPPVPSLFDPVFAKDRAVAMFMHSFIADFRARIDRMRRPHVDYLPTQVITEYFRTAVKLADNKPILGVLYSSTKNARDAIVLFAEHGDVVAGDTDGGEAEEDPWLRVIEYNEIDHIVLMAAPSAP